MNPDWNGIRKKFIGNRAFYRSLLLIIVPVIIQNVVTSFVSLLDNLMVGALGTNEMSGVSVANQLIFIFNLTIFGGLSGPGIYSAQFYGAGDTEGVRFTFRFKLVLGLTVSVAAILLFSFLGEPLIGLFLQGEAEGTEVDAGQMLSHAKVYLGTMLFGLPAYVVSQSYASTMRETSDAFWPMVASLTAVVTNLLGNWLLIFGNLGCPVLGVQGAAIATVISRYVELAVVAVRAHGHAEKYAFILGALRSLRVPGGLALRICKTGAPLLFNEAIWSAGISTLTVIYSLCGLTVVGALSIQSTISNLFNSFALCTGTGIAVIVGQSLGAGRFEEAKEQVWKIFAFSEALGLVISLLLFLFSGIIPEAYTQISPEVRQLASRLLRITALSLPIAVFANCSYFTLRSGGKTVITFLFDSVYTWVVSVFLAYILVCWAGLDIIPAYLIVTLADISKCILGYVLIRKGVWIHRITD